MLVILVVLMNMKFNISSAGLGLVLGAYSFLLGSCAVLDNKAAELAEVDSVPSYSSKVRQTYSHVTSRARDAHRSSSDLSPVDSVTVAASEPTKILKRARGEPWSREEENRLLKLRGQGMSWAEIHEFFPQRSWEAVSGRYYRLSGDPSAKKPPKKAKTWDAEEDKLLLELREENLPWVEIAKRFPARTAGAIQHRYRLLRRGNPAPEDVVRNYSAEEDKRLLKLAKSGIPWEERVKFFENRTLRGLKARFDKISPVKSSKKGPFTPKEHDLLLKALESNKTIEEISQLIGRKPEGIRRRINKLEQLNQLDLVPQMMPGRNYKDTDFELMGRLREENISWRDIAFEHFPGRPFSALRRAYGRYLQRKRRGQEKEEEEE